MFYFLLDNQVINVYNEWNVVDFFRNIYAMLPNPRDPYILQDIQEWFNTYEDNRLVLTGFKDLYGVGKYAEFKQKVVDEVVEKERESQNSYFGSLFPAPRHAPASGEIRKVVIDVNKLCRTRFDKLLCYIDEELQGAIEKTLKMNIGSADLMTVK